MDLVFRGRLMSNDSDGETFDEAYDRMKWCEAAVKQLKARSPRNARACWRNACERPAWLGEMPVARGNMRRVRTYLECEKRTWAETALRCSFQEPGADSAKVDEVRGQLQNDDDRVKLQIQLEALTKPLSSAVFQAQP